MKRAVFALTLLTILLASAAVASVLAETGISAVIAVGEDRKPIEVLLYFFDMDGVPLVRTDNMVLGWDGEPLNVQIFPKGIRSADEFVIGYTTDAVMPKNPKRAQFDPAYSFWIQLTPEETAQRGGCVRALQLATTDKLGRMPWFKVGFKFRNLFKGRAVTESDLILIKTQSRSQAIQPDSVGGGSDASAAINALVANQQKFKAYIETLEARVTNLEDHERQESAVSGSGQPNGRTVTFPILFTGRNRHMPGNTISIIDSGGRSTGYPVRANELTLTLAVGSYQMVVPMPQGGNSDPMPFAVSVGMKTLEVPF